jgi:hypothetical protein
MKRALNSTQYAELKLLSETVNHYNQSNRSVVNGTCQYVCPDGTSEGCAIGRLMTEEEKGILLEGDFGYLNNAESLEEMIEVFGAPQNVFGYRYYFLNELQNLHDNAVYWRASGPSEEGWVKIRSMREKILHNEYRGNAISKAEYKKFSRETFK